MLLGWAGMLVTQQDLIETHPYVSRLKSADKVLKTWRDGERRFTGGGGEGRQNGPLFSTSNTPPFVSVLIRSLDTKAMG